MRAADAEVSDLGAGPVRRDRVVFRKPLRAVSGCAALVGVLTPVGGSLMIVAWVSFALGVWRS